MFLFSEAFRGFQKRLQCMISELPETLQEVLGSLLNVMEPFLSQTDNGQMSVDMNESITTEKYLLTPESSMYVGSINSESTESEKEVNVFEEEVMDIVSETSLKQDKAFTLKTDKFDIDKKEQLNSVVNKENKQTVQPSQTGTEHTTNNKTLEPKEVSTQALEPMIQSLECLSTSAMETPADQQSIVQSEARTTTEERLSRIG